MLCITGRHTRGGNDALAYNAHCKGAHRGMKGGHRGCLASLGLAAPIAPLKRHRKKQWSEGIFSVTRGSKFASSTPDRGLAIKERQASQDSDRRPHRTQGSADNLMIALPPSWPLQRHVGCITCGPEGCSGVRQGGTWPSAQVTSSDITTVLTWVSTGHIAPEELRQ